MEKVESCSEDRSHKSGISSVYSSNVSDSQRRTARLLKEVRIKDLVRQGVLASNRNPMSGRPEKTDFFMVDSAGKRRQFILLSSYQISEGEREERVY